MEIDQTQWSTTSIPGLEVRQDRVTVTAMRLWGWEGALPLSLVRAAVEASADTADSMMLPVSDGQGTC